KKTNLRRSFVARARHGRVDAFLQLYPEFRARSFRDFAIISGIRLAHIGESWPKFFVVGSRQRIRPEQVDVIRDEDQIAGLVIRVDASGSIGQHDAADASSGEFADAEHNLRRGVAFVEMSPTG